jgi:hypothetical protein
VDFHGAFFERVLSSGLVAVSRSRQRHRRRLATLERPRHGLAPRRIPAQASERLMARSGSREYGSGTALTVTDPLLKVSIATLFPDGSERLVAGSVKETANAPAAEFGATVNKTCPRSNVAPELTTVPERGVENTSETIPAEACSISCRNCLREHHLYATD